jgi:hypothetical protein
VLLTTGSDSEPSHNDWPISQIPEMDSFGFTSAAFATSNNDAPMMAK